MKFSICLFVCLSLLLLCNLQQVLSKTSPIKSKSPFSSRFSSLKSQQKTQSSLKSTEVFEGRSDIENTRTINLPPVSSVFPPHPNTNYPPPSTSNVYPISPNPNGYPPHTNPNVYPPNTNPNVYPDPNGYPPNGNIYPNPSGSLNPSYNDIWDLTSYQYQSECLHAHNIKRQKHGVEPLIQDPRLVEIAVQVAANAARRGRPVQETNVPYGVNQGFSASRMDCEDSVRNWYDQSLHYDYNNPGYREDTAAFTQMIWASSRTVACAQVKSRTTQQYHIACVYSPYGNVRNRFVENVPPPGGRVIRPFPQPGPWNPNRPQPNPSGPWNNNRPPTYPRPLPGTNPTYPQPGYPTRPGYPPRPGYNNNRPYAASPVASPVASSTASASAAPTAPDTEVAVAGRESVESEINSDPSGSYEVPPPRTD